MVAVALCAAMAAISGASADAGALARKGNPKAFAFVPAGSGDDFVARWDPCKVIDYRVNLNQAPPHALSDVKEAVRRIHLASGLTFRYAGSTEMIPFRRGTYNKLPRGTDVVLSWARPGQSSWLPRSTDAIGVAGPTYHFPTSTEPDARIVAGYVVLDSTVDLKPGFQSARKPPWNSYGSVGQLLMHELGHVVGLGHVNDDHQIMFPILRQAPAVWGAGDVNGMARIGKPQGCFDSTDSKVAGGFERAAVVTTPSA